MELVLLQMVLVVLGFIVVLSIKVIGTLAFYGVKIYLLVRREKSKKPFLEA